MVAPAIRVAPNAAKRATSLLSAIQFGHPPTCPCHSNPSYHDARQPGQMANALRRHMSTPMDLSLQKEYAFEMSASSIRFGLGVTKEVGMDLSNMKARRVCIVTDPNVEKLDAMNHVRENLAREGIECTVYSQVRTEPKDSSYVL